MIFLIIALISTVPFAMIADVHSSARNRGLPGVWETTPFFQQGTDKQANIPKMAITFLIIFALMLAFALLTYRYWAGEISIVPFFVFPFYALIRLPHISKNYKINRRYRERQAKSEINKFYGSD